MFWHYVDNNTETADHGQIHGIPLVVDCRVFSHIQSGSENLTRKKQNIGNTIDKIPDAAHRREAGTANFCAGHHQIAMDLYRDELQLSKSIARGGVQLSVPRYEISFLQLPWWLDCYYTASK